MMKYLVHVMGSKTKSKFFFIIYAEITAIHMSISVYEMGPVSFFFNMDLESIN